MSDECRDAFEKWAQSVNLSIEKYQHIEIDDTYANSRTFLAFESYQAAWQARQKEIDQLVAALRIEHEKVIDLECMHHWTESLEKHYERINEKVGSDCSVCNLLAKYREARDA